MNPNAFNIKRMFFNRTTGAVLAPCALMAGIFLATLEAGGTNPGDNSPTGRHMTEAQKLAASDPKKDFATAKHKGDIHFYAVMGFTKEVLGVESSDKAYLKRVPVKVVEGTSDYFRSELERTTNAKASDYVLAYNRLVLEFLKEQHKHAK